METVPDWVLDAELEPLSVSDAAFAAREAADAEADDGQAIEAADQASRLRSTESLG